MFGSIKNEKSREKNREKTTTDLFAENRKKKDTR